LHPLKTFPSELQIFRRENQCGMYNVFSYYMTKSLIELPIHTLTPILFTSIFYWMGGLNPSIDRFFICCGILILSAHVSVSFGHFVSALSPTTSFASTIVSPIMGLMMLFSGCFINDATIPKYFLWVKYFSWLGYSSQTMVLNQWHNVTDIKCEGFTRCFATGDDIIDSLSFNPVTLFVFT
jgi:ABC-type multidrug transport system permease subunit